MGFIIRSVRILFYGATKWVSSLAQVGLSSRLGSWDSFVTIAPATWRVAIGSGTGSLVVGELLYSDSAPGARLLLPAWSSVARLVLAIMAAHILPVHVGIPTQPYFNWVGRMHGELFLFMSCQL